MRIDGLMLNAISKQIDTAFDEKDESTLQKSIDEINQLLIDEKINFVKIIQKKMADIGIYP